MNALIKSALLAVALGCTTQAFAQVTFYEREGFQGRSFTATKNVSDFENAGFNDRATAAVVVGERREVCEDSSFGGRCVVLRPGRYPSLAAMGLDDGVSSVRVIGRNVRIAQSRYAPNPMTPQVTFYENEGFGGRSFSTDQQIGDFERFGFNDRASSAIVVGAPREVCEDVRFGGRCVVLRPGRYPSMAAMGLNDRVSSVRAVNANANQRYDDYNNNSNRYTPTPTPVLAQVIFYEGENFEGRSFKTEDQIEDLSRYGFNDRASSVIVIGEQREVCEDARFGGRCATLPAGRYPSLAAMGLNNRISSVRIANMRTTTSDSRYNDNRNVPVPASAYNYQRRDNERLYEANVTSVRAVVGTPEQRCWVEKEQVQAPQEKTGANVPGAVIGAVLGGILGHQVGGGRGKDLATVGGAVAGGLVGSNVGRGGSTPQTTTQDVQRCSSVPSQSRADYWDVTYDFQGQEHRVQLSAPPGRTITVNEQGEPRA